MSSREEAVCDHCGSLIVTYKRVFNKGLARALWKAKKYGGAKQFNVADIKLANAEYAEFPKVKYWGLTEPVKIDGDRKAGVHRITDFGLDFLYGKVSIPKYVFVRKKEVVGESKERVYFKDVTAGYEYSEDYKDQVRAQL